MGDYWSGRIFIPLEYRKEAEQVFENEDFDEWSAGPNNPNLYRHGGKTVLEYEFSEERNGGEDISDALRYFETEEGEARPIPHCLECDSYHEYQPEVLFFDGVEGNRQVITEDGSFFIAVSDEGEPDIAALTEIRKFLAFRQAWFDQFLGGMPFRRVPQLEGGEVLEDDEVLEDAE